ncbi:hypothetical protein DICPUDRAFT_89422 [Dictyostelium purpureum]|uniref:Protein MAK16 homolog n=1 Tax=Dictyostelium purpureum TaxID=5786 RepID=F0ZVQ3_DICPU|nr:uncharacterized protein DICPUDRAFT_89422 [Dictyostelium purpureum]EGC31960.1 hypothetical protein DICPUDRAFT_89422 [Dictyostelium purpureum]|eukprot:XP_003291496.1 hypothetical protein DICPUDRAFT_89422 [Dictyostelium purpureum]
MQSDDIIWDVISKNFCSYRSTFNKTKFCRNEYNVTGVCNKVSCPLANSRYATVREEQGVIYLYMKTVERAHTPSKLWEKIKLDPNFMKAIEQIDSNLEFWPGHMSHRVKQRFIRITQYLIRMRKMRKQIRRELVPINKKAERRDKTRENKALVAAHLTVNIKKELLSRLSKGTYSEMNYFPEEVFNEVLNKEGDQDELDEEEIEEEEELEEEYEDEIDDLENGGDIEYVEGDDDEFDDDDDEFDANNYTSPYDDEEEDGDDDDEDDNGDDDEVNIKPNTTNKRTSYSIPTRKSTRPYVHLEYEKEYEEEHN